LKVVAWNRTALTQSVDFYRVAQKFSQSSLNRIKTRQ